MDKLTLFLFAKGFRGELVCADLNDAPALAPLPRIVLGIRLLDLVLQRSGSQRTDTQDAQDDQR